MTNIRIEIKSPLIATGEAAKLLGIAPLSASRLVRMGQLPAERVGRFYAVPLAAVQQFAINYSGKPGRPRTKRKYTKRSARWNK